MIGTHDHDFWMRISQLDFKFDYVDEFLVKIEDFNHNQMSRDYKTRIKKEEGVNMGERIEEDLEARDQQMKSSFQQAADKIVNKYSDSQSSREKEIEELNENDISRKSLHKFLIVSKLKEEILGEN